MCRAAFPEGEASYSPALLDFQDEDGEKMIEIADFFSKFDEMLASLNKSMTKEYKKIWYEKFKYQTWEVFEKAVDEMVMTSDKLPTIPQLLAVCHRIKASVSGEMLRGCEWCKNGWVLYEPRKGRGAGQGIAVRCSHCNQKAGEPSYDAKRNKRGLILLYDIGPRDETPVKGPFPALEVGEKIITHESEEEKAAARKKSLQLERERVAKEQDFPYANIDEVPF